MKRNLFQNVTAIPYKSGEAIDRTGFLSAVIGANVASPQGRRRSRRSR